MKIFFFDNKKMYFLMYFLETKFLNNVIKINTEGIINVLTAFNRSVVFVQNYAITRF